MLEENRERRRPPPPPIKPHSPGDEGPDRGRYGTLLKQVPEGMDLEEALAKNDRLANAGAHIVLLIREEQDFLIGQGVDPRPYARHEPKF